MISSRSSMVTISTSNDGSSISYLSVSERDKNYQPSHDSASTTASTDYDYTSDISPAGTRAVFRYSHASSSAPSWNTFGSAPKLPLSSPDGSVDESSPHSIASLKLPSEKVDLPVPCTCEFRPMGYGTMALYPPKNASDQTPLYVISVSPNCFVPTSFVTTVESGRTERSIATFEMGPSRDPPTLFTDHTAYQLDDVLKPFRVVKSLGFDRWSWERGNFKLHWMYENLYKAVCSLSQDPNHTPIASLTSAAAAYSQGDAVAPPPTTRYLPKKRNSTATNASVSSSGSSTVSLNGLPVTLLKVTVSDEALLDEIVVSALIVERKRLMPKTGWPQ